MFTTGIAKGLPYPGPGCIPPWAKLSQTPSEFFDLTSVPDGVKISDPSRMNVEPINGCLQFWLNAQQNSGNRFRFHHVWSETLGAFQAAADLPETVDEDETHRARKQKKKTGREKSKYKGKTKEMLQGQADKSTAMHDGKKTSSLKIGNTKIK